MYACTNFVCVYVCMCVCMCVCVCVCVCCELGNRDTPDLPHELYTPPVSSLDLLCLLPFSHTLLQLKHIDLVSLTLVGNPISTTAHYRHHVVDILPRLWSLDGVPITCHEREAVRHCFESPDANPKLRRQRPRTSCECWWC